jgi:hypothetical protein
MHNKYLTLKRNKVLREVENELIEFLEKSTLIGDDKKQVVLELLKESTVYVVDRYAKEMGIFQS